MSITADYFKYAKYSGDVQFFWQTIFCQLVDHLLREQKYTK